MEIRSGWILGLSFLWLAACGSEKSDSLFDIRFSSRSSITPDDVLGYWESVSESVNGYSCEYRLKLEEDLLTVSVRFTGPREKIVDTQFTTSSMNGNKLTTESYLEASAETKADFTGYYQFCDWKLPAGSYFIRAEDGILNGDFGAYGKLADL